MNYFMINGKNTKLELTHPINSPIQVPHLTQIYSNYGLRFAGPNLLDYNMIFNISCCIFEGEHLNIKSDYNPCWEICFVTKIQRVNENLDFENHKSHLVDNLKNPAIKVGRLPELATVNDEVLPQSPFNFKDNRGLSGAAGYYLGTNGTSAVVPIEI